MSDDDIDNFTPPEAPSPPSEDENSPLLSEDEKFKVNISENEKWKSDIRGRVVCKADIDKIKTNPIERLLKVTVKFSNILIPVINLANLSLGARLWYAFKEEKLTSNDKKIITATFVISLLFTVYLFYVIYVQFNDGNMLIDKDCVNINMIPILSVPYKKKRMILFYLMVSVFQLITSYGMFSRADSENFTSTDKNNAMSFTLLSVFSFILSSSIIAYNMYKKKKSK